MTEEQQKENQLQVFEKSLEVIRTAPNALQENQQMVERIQLAGQALLDLIEKNGGKLNEELDAKAKAFMQKLSQRMKELNDRRAPFTQLMTKLSKQFTELEALVDKDNKSSLGYKVQVFRNNYQKQLADEAERIRQDAIRKENKIREEGTYQASVLVNLTAFYTDAIATRKRKMLDYFDAATLEDLDSRRDFIKGAELNSPKLEEWRPMITTVYLTNEEKIAFAQKILDDNQDRLNAEYKQQLDLYRIETIDRTETKRSTLLALKAAKDDAEKLKQLQNQEAATRAADLKKQQDAEEALKQQAVQKGNALASASATQALFQTAVLTSEVAKAPEKPTGYEIVFVKNPGSGYLMLVNAWMQEVGFKMTTEELDKTKLIQIKKWASDKKSRNPDDYIESEFITYQPIYKANNR